MLDRWRRRMLGRLLVLFLVLVVAFLCGWRSMDLAGGVAMATALGSGVGVAMFGQPAGTQGTCFGRTRRRTG